VQQLLVLSQSLMIYWMGKNGKSTLLISKLPSCRGHQLSEPYICFLHQRRILANSAPPEAHTSKLWQLNIPVYGLCDAPRAGWPLKLQCKIPVHSSTFSSTYFSFQVPQMTDYQYINQNLSSFKKKIPVFSSTRI